MGTRMLSHQPPNRHRVRRIGLLPPLRRAFCVRLIGALLVACSLVVDVAEAQKKPKKVDCMKDLRAADLVMNAAWAFKRYRYGESRTFVQVFLSVTEAARAAKAPEACADVLERYLAQLNDGHAGLQYYPGVEYSRPAIALLSVRQRDSRYAGEDPAVRVYVSARDTADEMLREMTPGSELLSVDGVPIDSAYALVQARSPGSTQQWRDYMSDSRLLRGPADSVVEVTLREPGGRTRSIRVRRPPFSGYRGEPLDTVLFWDTLHVSRWERLEEGWGYLRYSSFLHKDAESAAAVFEEALDSVMDTPGLIIDLRGNSGGFIDAIGLIAGHFITDEATLGFTFGVEKTREKKIKFENWAPTAVSDTNRTPVVATPRQDVYTRPVVILIDRGCFSACEGFTGGLQAIGRALVVGSPSGGGGGLAMAAELPSGAIIAFSWSVFWLPDGELIEGRGILPDVYVTSRPRDWAVGRDRVLERSIRALEGGEAKPLAGPTEEIR